MPLQPAENADTWRGALTALALVALLIGLFALFALAFDGELRVPDAVRRQFSSEPEAGPGAGAAPSDKAVAETSESKKAEPTTADSKKEESKKTAEDGSQLPASPGRGANGPAGVQATAKSGAPSGAPSEAADGARSAAASPPASAGEALGQILKAYRPDPHRTATVSITSLGGIRPQGAGTATVFDGLPARSVSQATLVTGGLPRDGSAARY